MNFVKRIQVTSQSLLNVFGDPGLLSYYPESARKSRLQIALEHLWWMIRYGEINHFYYFHGCDRLDGPSIRDYVCKKRFIRLRDRLNAQAHVGGRVINYNCLLQDKFLFSQYLRALGFASPEVYGLADRSQIVRQADRKRISWEDFVGTMQGRWFIKDVIGERGEHVFSLDVQDGHARLGGQPVTVDELKSRIGLKNILQDRIVQHDLLNHMNPGSVNTLRLVTARAGGRIEPLSAMLRLGVKGSACDNLASGGMAVGIDPATGALSDRGIFKPGYGKWASSHPDTKFVFKGARLPFFQEAVESACRLHAFFYGTHSIGWDIAFGEQGPLFLEGNNSWEIPTLQVFDRDLIPKFFRTLEHNVETVYSDGSKHGYRNYSRAGRTRVRQARDPYAGRSDKTDEGGDWRLCGNGGGQRFTDYR
jgi:hypothetical protein